MITLKKYNADLLSQWNEFVVASKNGLFLFERAYMDYHSDRFTDHSLLFFNDDELVCVMPASSNGNVYTSHAGLTFGGLLMSKRTSTLVILSIFEQLAAYLRENGFLAFIYKCIPYIYHEIPSQEDLYALFRQNATLYRRDLNSVIEINSNRSYTKGTKANLSKARKNNVKVAESHEYTTLMDILSGILQTKFGIQPTHTAEELQMLASRFPDNIKLYMAYTGDTCLGGLVLYITKQVVHAQYIGITDEGKLIGALDSIMDFILNLFQHSHRYFSFGISSTGEGRVVNEGLTRNKESFGARAIVHDFYKIQLA